MIIGISGKKQAGKDTVAKMIQYFTHMDKLVEEDPEWRGYQNTNPFTYPDYQDWLLYGDDSNQPPLWENKKFAHKVKEIAAIILGEPDFIEKWENDDDNIYRDFPLSKEWDRIAVVETDYVISNIRAYFNTVKEAEAYKIFHEQKMGYRKPLYIDKEVPLTRRILLQEIGTNLFRNTLHMNTWVNALMSEYKCSCGDDLIVREVTHVLFEECKIPNWIISDVRFPNEAEAIKNSAGLLLRIERETDSKDIHPSETALDTYRGFDWHINNNCTKENLFDAVLKFLIAKNIIRNV